MTKHFYNPVNNHTLEIGPDSPLTLKACIESGWKEYHQNLEPFVGIDWYLLFRWINWNLFKLNHAEGFSIDLTGKRPKIVCENLQSQSGIFSAVIKEVTVGFFNFEQNKEGGFWCNVFLQYESWSGGHNGMEIGNVWYHADKGWKFESAKERHEKYQTK